MAANMKWWIVIVVVWLVACSDGQINQLGSPGCSGDSAPNITEFRIAINTTFSRLRANLSSGSWFATAHTQAPQFYTMAQCRNYLSQPDCLACYDAAMSSVRRRCSNDTGGRVYFDQCFLRYESYNFYIKTNEDYYVTCGETSSTPEFSAEAQNTLRDLMLATPQTNNYFGAIRRQVVGGGSSTVYAVAQCAETVSLTGCQTCLSGGYEELQHSCTQQSVTEGRLLDGACFMRYSNRPFFPDNQAMDLKRYLSRGSRNNDAIIGGGVAGGACLVIILVSAILWYKFSRQMKAIMIGNLLGATKLQSPNRFSFEDLKKATSDFSEENKIGQGSFGIVYKATLKNATIVAVKKLEMNYRARADFETEVRIISNAHHRNLVRLLGSCTNRSEMLLVYEYMKNGSLDRFIYGDRRGTLSWKQRFDIISGTAKGIAYLHENYHVTVIHRDIKPSNILLDNEFQAKIADFGMARLLGEDQSHVSTKFAGTLGYTAPEYATYGHLSEKVDIYSFGIVILEIISGRKCTDLNMNSTESHSGTSYLLLQAYNLYESGMHHNLADESLQDSDGYSAEELKKLVEIALACTHSTPSSRPSMSEIVAMIFSNQPIKLNSSISVSESHGSHASISISDYTGR